GAIYPVEVRAGRRVELRHRLVGDLLEVLVGYAGDTGFVAIALQRHTSVGEHRGRAGGHASDHFVGRLPQGQVGRLDLEIVGSAGETGEPRILEWLTVVGHLFRRQWRRRLRHGHSGCVHQCNVREWRDRTDGKESTTIDRGHLAYLP